MAQGRSTNKWTRNSRLSIKISLSGSPQVQQLESFEKRAERTRNPKPSTVNPKSSTQTLNPNLGIHFVCGVRSADRANAGFEMFNTLPAAGPEAWDKLVAGESWKGPMEKRFPALAMLARDFLLVTAPEASSERVLAKPPATRSELFRRSREGRFPLNTKL